MPAPNPEDFAVVIGIGDYAGILPDIPSAEEDAACFAAWLKREDGGGLEPENVHLLLGSQFSRPPEPEDFQPNREDILKKLRILKLHRGLPRVGRRLYVFFSGHGIGVDFDEVVMLLRNATRKTVGEHHLGLRGSRSYLVHSAPFDQLVFILDCCRNRGVFTTQPRGIDFTLEEINPRFNAVCQIVAFATQYGDQAFDAGNAATGFQGGLLTQALLEGLKDRKAANPQGEITAATLKVWIEKRVTELAKDAAVTQLARVEEAAAGILFGPVVPAVTEIPQIQVTVQIRKDRAPPIRLTRGDGGLVTEWQLAPAPWQFTVPRNDLYILEHPATGDERAIRPQQITGENHVVHF